MALSPILDLGKLLINNSGLGTMGLFLSLTLSPTSNSSYLCSLGEKKELNTLTNIIKHLFWAWQRCQILSVHEENLDRTKQP